MVDEDFEQDNELIDRDPLCLIDFDKSNQDGWNDKTEAELFTNDDTVAGYTGLSV